MVGSAHEVAVDDAVPVWALLFEVAETVPSHEWVLAGGLMVHLHALRAGVDAPRPTTDVDAVIDVTASSFARVAGRLTQRGFAVQQHYRGPVHRLVRLRAVGTAHDIIDLMVPRNAPRTRYAMRPVLRAPGADQAIRRRDEYTLRGLAGRLITVGVPDALGSIVSKAVAYEVDSRDRERHLGDLAVLLASNSRRTLDLSATTTKDAQRVRRALGHLAEPVSAHWLALRNRDRRRGLATMAVLNDWLANPSSSQG